MDSHFSRISAIHLAIKGGGTKLRSLFQVSLYESKWDCHRMVKELSRFHILLAYDLRLILRCGRVCFSNSGSSISKDHAIHNTDHHADSYYGNGDAAICPD